MFKKSLLYIPNYSWWSDTLENLWDSGWVYHFNSIPNQKDCEVTNSWIKKTYEGLYG